LAAAVRRLHERVNDTLPEAAGPYAADTAYSALDPELMLWALAVIADSGRQERLSSPDLQAGA
jgi:uncharacterized protein (DUF2236 family)